MRVSLSIFAICTLLGTVLYAQVIAPAGSDARRSRPVIRALEPSAGPVGTEVAIYGRNLPHNPRIVVGGREVQPTAVGRRRLCFAVPQVPSGELSVVILTRRGRLAAGTFRVRAEGAPRGQRHRSRRSLLRR